MALEKENFASRWSRRKQAVADEQPDEQKTVEEEPIVDEATLAEQKLEALNQLTDEDMPDIEALNEDSDFSGFMSTGVTETLRKMALQKLFHGKSYNIRDGLDEYDGDYTSFEKLDPSVITCDMKHILEVEAEKLLAKEEAEKKEKEDQLIAESDDATSDSELETENDITENNKDGSEDMVAEVTELDTNTMEYDDMELDDIEGEDV